MKKNIIILSSLFLIFVSVPALAATGFTVLPGGFLGKLNRVYADEVINGIGMYLVPSEVTIADATGVAATAVETIALPEAALASIAGDVLLIGGALAAGYVLENSPAFFTNSGISVVSGNSTGSKPAYQQTKDVMAVGGNNFDGSQGSYCSAWSISLNLCSTHTNILYNGVAANSAAAQSACANISNSCINSSAQVYVKYNCSAADPYGLSNTVVVHVNGVGFYKAESGTGTVTDNYFFYPLSGVTTTTAKETNGMTDSDMQNQINANLASANPQVAAEAKAMLTTALQPVSQAVASPANNPLVQSPAWPNIVQNFLSNLTPTQKANLYSSAQANGTTIANTAPASDPAGLSQPQVQAAMNDALSNVLGPQAVAPPDIPIVMPDKLSLTTVMQSFMDSINGLPMMQTLHGLAINVSGGTSQLCLALPTDMGGQRCYDCGNFSTTLAMIGNALLGLTTLFSFLYVFKG